MTEGLAGIGLYHKYKIVKTSGEPIEPDAQYFVLRVDTDVHARLALRTYALSVSRTNPILAAEIIDWLAETATSPAGRIEFRHTKEVVQ